MHHTHVVTLNSLISLTYIPTVRLNYIFESIFLLMYKSNPVKHLSVTVFNLLEDVCCQRLYHLNTNHVEQNCL